MKTTPENHTFLPCGVERLVMPQLRGYTKTLAIENGMSRDTITEDKTKYCPECGCPWYGNINQCGEGHRTCCDCYQEWWTDIEYDEMPPLRELPES
ncbi:MAG: hypothetical protein DRP02_11855 [Candidatus Gerdarchaeota archaeon]|nr:MAG: hypothetical protein DRP02_11855 [Candidatus Gerdarchaeota archaeon]